MDKHKKILNEYLHGNLSALEEITEKEKEIASIGAIHIPFYESLTIRLNHNIYCKFFAFSHALKQALDTKNIKNFKDIYHEKYGTISKE